MSQITSAFSKFAGQTTALCGAAYVLLFCSCSIDTEKKIIGNWVSVPDGNYSLTIDEVNIVWVSKVMNTSDTLNYWIKNDSIRVERGEHMRGGQGIGSALIVFDSSDKFYLQGSGEVKKYDSWYERVE